MDIAPAPRFHHVATFRFALGIDDVEVESLATDLTSLAAELEGLVSYACGTDLDLRTGNDDFAVAAVFDGADALRSYLAHPLHLEIARRYAASMAEKHSAQFRGGSGLPTTST
jgi:hypothetical protein